jgi:hypothetical protein
MDLDSDIHNLFPNVLDPNIKDSFKFSSSVAWVQPGPDVTPWSELNQNYSVYGIGEPHIYSQSLQGSNHDQSFVSSLTNLTPSSFSNLALPSCSYPLVNLGAPIPDSSASGNPTTEELNQYCRWLWLQPRRPCTGLHWLIVNDSVYLFFTEFSTYIPQSHLPTWNIEDAYPVLVKAMRACGALFTKTLTATNFFINTLWHLLETWCC